MAIIDQAGAQERQSASTAKKLDTSVRLVRDGGSADAPAASAGVISLRPISTHLTAAQPVSSRPVASRRVPSRPVASRLIGARRSVFGGSFLKRKRNTARKRKQ